MKKAVQKVVRGNIETKFCMTPIQMASGLGSLNLFTGFTSGITSTAEIYSLLPIVNQGSDSFQRLGDNIRPTRLNVKLNIAAYGSYLKSFDQTVYVWFLTCDAVKTISNFSAMPITQMLDNGQGAAIPFDGTSMVALQPLNKKVFKLLKLTKKRIIINLAGSNISQTMTDKTHTHHSLSFNIPVPKVLQYNNYNDPYPQNYAPVMVIGFVDNTDSGDTAPGSGYTVMVEGSVGLYYKDA